MNYPEEFECKCQHCGHLNFGPEPFYSTDTCEKCGKKIKEAGDS